MGVGKYSPTVDVAYSKDQSWWEKNGGGIVHVNYDNDGYDSYGYNVEGKDRAGYTEWDYVASGKWVTYNKGEQDEYEDFEYSLAQDVYSMWSVNENGNPDRR